jgi:Protein of unknown function (DUF3305)
MSAPEKQNPPSSRYAVSVIMERREVQHGRWLLPEWEAVGVIAGANAPAASAEQRTVIRADAARQQYLWGGFVVELFKDGAENYWYNLIGETPSVYIVCRRDLEKDEELIPIMVTVDCGEADMHAEADDEVFAVAMPPEVYRWLEEYVVKNYVPRERKKRKRKNWVEESIYGKQKPQGHKNGAG